ncbi:Type 1 glutamine amidotransferase-like domain-containing protein [Ectobacillus antri]|jgi:peptidase E|uniref:Type 1 glutamine amidotransferase-like domain-containing protein n=1 Tax=Ectobacillus antri TaxID=2486280 RepID=A0ABT6H1E4_9BACI|nr:Type 1 glutamine amidotransferase-like domain-containing protein [Ectobacillus antri]MDG4656319.1 Type 1 glutamine amidotransferase-like domain-containing protein [Ectobacillus antri]MDG5752994.1 Type 1 glutamine amidotransferase-like domain-containing protein [Ectobacillus antri]
MKPILLTANGFQDEKVIHAFLEVVRIHHIPKKVALIPTADAVYKERNYHAVHTMEILQENGFEAVYIDIEFQQVQALCEYPIIYLNGGSPFYFLKQLRKSQADQQLRRLYAQGVFLIGTSAGAAVLGESLAHAAHLHPDWREGMHSLEGLKLISAHILPHSNRYEHLQDELEMFQPLICIKDGEYKLI